MHSAFARRLSEALSRYGECALIDAEAALGQTSAWFSALESRVRFVVYLGGAADDDWRNLCLRQADCLLFLADAAQAATPWHGEQAFDAERVLHRPQHLLLLHRGGVIKFGAAAQWLQEFSTDSPASSRARRARHRTRRAIADRTQHRTRALRRRRARLRAHRRGACAARGGHADRLRRRHLDRRHHRRGRGGGLVRRGDVRKLPPRVRTRQTAARLHVSVRRAGQRTPRVATAARRIRTARHQRSCAAVFLRHRQSHRWARRRRIAAARCGSGCALRARSPACCRRCSITTKCSSTAR